MRRWQSRSARLGIGWCSRPRRLAESTAPRRTGSQGFLRTQGTQGSNRSSCRQSPHRGPQWTTCCSHLPPLRSTPRFGLEGRPRRRVRWCPNAPSAGRLVGSNRPQGPRWRTPTPRARRCIRALRIRARWRWPQCLRSSRPLKRHSTHRATQTNRQIQSRSCGCSPRGRFGSACFGTQACG